MLALSDYLDLSIASAQRQWIEIVDRAPLGPSRQADFTPIETLLCFGLGLVALPSPSGRVNIRESDPTVKALASLVKRTPASLAAKLANLDGRRANGAKNERALWLELTDDFSLFEAIYATIIDAGRGLGLDANVLPDFLGAADLTFHAILDADQTTTDQISESIEGEIRLWVAANPGGDVASTERSMIGMVRVGQKQFARRVLENYDYACAFCGLTFKKHGLPTSRMLVASHVKPWRHSDNKERVDVGNGIAACPTHDAGFDGLLFTLDHRMNVVLTSHLQRAVEMDPIVARNFGGEGMYAKLQLPRNAAPDSEHYFQWHRDAVLST